MEQREMTTEPRVEETGQELESRTRRRKGANKSAKRTSQENGKSMPGYVKFLISLGLLLVSLVAGLIVGFSIVGNGSVGDALDIETYKHLYDLVFKVG